jgi:hypothetical protein
MKIFKEIINREDTGEIIIIDEREFSHCVEHQLKVIKEHAKELILKTVPEYKQRNAALGLLSQAETDQVKTDIQNIRSISNQKEAEILAVIWDGTENTRSNACDAVQSVRWD